MSNTENVDEVFETLNNLRADPVSQVKRLKSIAKFFKRTRDSVAVEIEDFVGFLEVMKPLHPLKKSKGLYKAATEIAKKILESENSKVKLPQKDLEEICSEHLTSFNTLWLIQDVGDYDHILSRVIVSDLDPKKENKQALLSDTYSYVGIDSYTLDDSDLTIVILADYVEEKPDPVIPVIEPEIEENKEDAVEAEGELPDVEKDEESREDLKPEEIEKEPIQEVIEPIAQEPNQEKEDLTEGLGQEENNDKKQLNMNQSSSSEKPLHQFEIQEPKDPKSNFSIRLASFTIKDPLTKENFQIKKLWEDSQEEFILLHFMRRFGSRICRWHAQEISNVVKKINNEKKAVKLIGIGNSFVDYHDFVEGKFFDGPIYINDSKSIYYELNMTKNNCCNCWGCTCSMFSIGDKAKKKGIRNNCSGDKSQNGGDFLIKRNGQVLFKFVQGTPADCITQNDLEYAIKMSREYDIERNYQQN